ncbi:sulfate transport system permease protein [Dongia mobilis]|uniref:Sulfate transport system permease protein n=1 Tax=Dongia mobilis TaxID=578943 RepID=A0A4R6X2V0_9PROT|nr:sulfate transport system permease protein [Dongia mobilis]
MAAAGATPGAHGAAPYRRRVAQGPLARTVLIGLAGIVAVLFLLLPVIVIFVEALSLGVGAYVEAVIEPSTLHAVWLTLLTALVVVPVNVVFGIAAAWCITRFEFKGKKLLITLIEIPFSVSPIVAGISYLFFYGSQGLLGPVLAAYDIRIMFSVPAIMLASMFVTSPFVARELIATMQVQGNEYEEAALSLGASGFKTFLKVTLPNMKWGLLYGALLCNARVMGEFGAVSVVSGSIRGQTNTLPLQIELLFNDYSAVGAFAAASLLTLLAVFSLLAKAWLERRR